MPFHPVIQRRCICERTIQVSTLSPAISWVSGAWSRPTRTRPDGNALIASAEKGSDLWESTVYGFRHRNAHALLAPWDDTRAIEVRFDISTLQGEYDQAGAVFVVSESTWLKAGVEIADGVPNVSTVVARDGWSDWAAAPTPEWAGSEVTVRISPLADGLIVRARADNTRWRTVRVLPLLPSTRADVGPYLAAPTREGLDVKFLEWRSRTPDIALHAEPPF
jgi:regulation of enolase protein 1 (concanavalin A-like superfamily)